MNIVNNGLQCVGAMRAKIGDQFEKAVGLYKHSFLSVKYDTFKHNLSINKFEPHYSAMLYNLHLIIVDNFFLKNIKL